MQLTRRVRGHVMLVLPDVYELLGWLSHGTASFRVANACSLEH